MSDTANKHKLPLVQASILLFYLLFVSSLGRSQIIERDTGIAIIILSFIIVISILIIYNNLYLLAPKPLLLGLGGLFIIFSIHLLLGNVGYLSLVILPYYTIGFSMIFMCVIPAIIDQKLSMRIILYFSLFLGIIGLIPVFVTPISINILSIDITAWPLLSDAPPYIPTYGALRTILSNPNFAGTLFFVGGIIALHNFIENQSPASVSIFLLLIIILFLTQSRGSMGAFLFSFVIYIGYLIFGKKYILPVTIFTMILLSIAVLSWGMFLPPIGLLESIDLSNRGIIYRGAILATIDTNPLFGVGIFNTSVIASEYYIDPNLSLVIHSTYFHILLRAGVIGLIFWIIALFGSLGYHLLVYDNIDILPVSLVSGFSLLFFFETIHPFSSVRLSVALFSLSIGYLFRSNVCTVHIKY